MPENLHKWLVGVDDKLSKHDGLQLLKILYYKDGIPEGDLDRATKPTHIYSVSKTCQKGDVHQTVALLVHRLTLLVPRSTQTASDAEGSDATLDPEKLSKAKDLGAQACLSYLEDEGCRVTRPDIQVDDLISPGARLLECLVTAYVNVSPRKRRALRDMLASIVAVHPTQFDLFNLVCKFLREGKDNVESTVSEFVNALNNVAVPEPVYEQLRQQLDSHNIPHTPFSIGDMKVHKETVDDYISETTPLLGGRQTHHHHHHNHCTRMITWRCFICCLIPFITAALFALAVVISTATRSVHSKTRMDSFETSNRMYPKDDVCHVTGTAAPLLIHLGSFYNRWYNGALLKQDLPNDDYQYTDMEIFSVPSENVVEHSQHFHCEARGDVAVFLAGIYLLKEIIMRFNICIQSTDVDIPGWVDIAFYDDYGNWSIRNDGDKIFKQHRFHVNASEPKCYKYEFVSTHDSLYYIIGGADYQCSSSNVSVIFYSVDVEAKYVNSSDWLGTSHTSVCDHKQTECSIPFPDDSDWLFSTTKYEIFARVTSVSEDIHGRLSVRPLFREASYAIPTVFGLLVVVPLEAVCIVSALCYCCYCSRKQRERNRTIKACQELQVSIQ